jgi:hypothetical protein
VNEITQKVAQELLLENQLHLIGTGSQMMAEIEMLAISFDFSNEIDITKARELLVKSINKYIEEINSNNKIRKYLKCYPFTEKNIEVRIWVRTPKSTPSYISAINGELSYFMDTPYTYSQIALRKETYEEAVKILSSPCQN